MSDQTHGPSQRGAVAVEFAIVIVVMLLIVAGAVGFGRAYWYANALTKSTRDGARLLSTWPKTTIQSAGVGAAQTITLNSGNAANVNPPLATANVIVECLSSAFNVVACVDGTAPANVRVRITGFSVNLSEWFPFVSGQVFGTVDFSPATTMRYMN